MSNFTVSKDQTALLIVDMQEKVFAAVDHGNEVLQTVIRLIKGFQVLGIPIFTSEQYPEGLGDTLFPIRTALGVDYKPYKKTTFSCFDHPEFLQCPQLSHIKQWVVVGIEAHICVLQTAKGLINLGKQVVVLNDAISSRSIYDFSTSIAEMRDIGIRISCSETILFELLRDSKVPEFKEISQQIKSRCCI
jgi:nicotinamidase-related amidase